MTRARRLAGQASRGRPGAAAGWLAGSVLLHAGLGLALAGLQRDLPQPAASRQVALVWTEQGTGAGDAADSAGAAALESAPESAPLGRPDPPASADPAPEAAPEVPPEVSQAEALGPQVPLPPPPPPRRPPATVSRQATAPAAPNPAAPPAAADAPPLAAGGIEVLGAVRPPRQLGAGFNAPPAYPGSSRFRNEQGRVTLMVEIGPTGQVTDAAVQVSAGYPALDRAALEAVRSWRFEPAMRDGQPVRFVTSLNISFQLEGGLRW